MGNIFYKKEIFIMINSFKTLLIIYFLMTGSTSFAYELNNTDNTIIKDKNNHDDFILKKEWTTFATEENLNGPIRTLLNNFTIWMKGIATQNMLFALLALLLLFGVITADPLFWIIIIANDLFYSNPLAIIGDFIDVVITSWKFFFAIFRIYF